jgi:hypothetical protein
VHGIPHAHGTTGEVACSCPFNLVCMGACNVAFAMLSPCLLCTQLLPQSVLQHFFPNACDLTFYSQQCPAGVAPIEWSGAALLVWKAPPLAGCMPTLEQCLLDTVVPQQGPHAPHPSRGIRMGAFRLHTAASISLSCL